MEQEVLSGDERDIKTALRSRLLNVVRLALCPGLQTGLTNALDPTRERIEEGPPFLLRVWEMGRESPMTVK
jgi:hypothetical protein